jgi:hypothetical protein
MLHRKQGNLYLQPCLPLPREAASWKRHYEFTLVFVVSGIPDKKLTKECMRSSLHILPCKSHWNMC